MLERAMLGRAVRSRTVMPLQRIAQLASERAVHQAFRSFHLGEQRIRGWQREAVSIPAPPFGEEPRARWMAGQMVELGLTDVHLDAAGNALGLLQDDNSAHGPLVLLSAHLDTVFPGTDPVRVEDDGSRLTGPGIADNGAGLAALLAVAAAMRQAGLSPRCNILFASNVGEEAEGDLRGMRHLFHGSKYAGRIRGAIALEGAGNETVVARALGSKRFRVEISGPGGHAWTDSEVPNPLLALARAMTEMAAVKPPERPRTTVNLGTMRGGKAVTSIPEFAEATVDIRSTAAEEIVPLEVRLHRCVEDAVLEANRGSDGPLHARVTCIGHRPAGELQADSHLLQSVRAVDRHLNLRTQERLGSTDANVPLSLGYQAIAIGAGGTAGGIHTTHEWYDPAGRDLALRRILLVLLDLCAWAAEPERP